MKTKPGSATFALLTLGLTTGCGGTAQSDSERPLPFETEETSNPDEAPPAPVASLELDNGNTLEFYDFGSAALISEIGKAGVDPKYEAPLDASERVPEIWEAMAPETPVPERLHDLQRRIDESAALAEAEVRMDALGEVVNPGAVPAGLEDEVDALDAAVSGEKGLVYKAPNGCNNGCCDNEWLRTLRPCSVHFPFSWYLYNYGWSYANSPRRIWYYEGLVCAATGTSTYRVSIKGGSGGTWSVPQGYFRTYNWSTAGVKRWMTSSVNSASSPALHTYCGGTPN